MMVSRGGVSIAPGSPFLDFPLVLLAGLPCAINGRVGSVSCESDWRLAEIRCVSADQLRWMCLEISSLESGHAKCPWPAIAEPSLRTFSQWHG